MTRRLWTVALCAILTIVLSMALVRGPSAQAAHVYAKPTATATSSTATTPKVSSGNPGPLGVSRVVPSTGGAAGQPGTDPLPLAMGAMILLGLGVTLRKRFARRE
ncbi:MAG: hypothetical protein ACRDFS_12110 [Chloroflexota bacterium]